MFLVESENNLFLLVYQNELEMRKLGQCFL